MLKCIARLGYAVVLLLAAAAPATADELLKIATSAGPVGQTGV